MKRFVLTAVTVSVIFLIAACSATTNTTNDHKNMKDKKTSQTETATKPLKVEKGPEVTLIAREEKQKLGNGVIVPVWTFNGSSPGPEIRVKKGEQVKVTLKNELSAPVSVHWHGYPVPNNMDGIPGVTQDAVEPGKSFTYEFKANVPGTYWYHSHQDSVNQLDRGLYGALIVEDTKEKYDKDYTLMLDEWITDKEEINKQLKEMTKGKTEKADSKKSSMDNDNTKKNDDMKGMDHSGMDMDSDKKDSGNMTGMGHGNMKMEGHNMSMYDLFTINGKSGDLVEPLKVNKGDKVRLRLVNAGYLSHDIHVYGHDIKVIATDGQPINDPKVIKDKIISIAPGERYDVEFTANNPGKWYVEDHSENKDVKGMKAVIKYDGSKEMKDKADEKEKLSELDMTKYGAKKLGGFTLNQQYTATYNMDLNTQMNGNEMVYTINGKVFPDIDPIQIKKGDLVKVKLVNRSKMDDHPMHLHGHFFQVLSKDGKPIEGSPIVKDTLNLKPGEEYEVAFVADNPGDWMFHCHDLHHASAGMVTEVKYTDYKSDYVPNPNIPNKPE
ncbi:MULTISPECIES: multicopper oxidase family protein [Bacillus cereus group]|uniref:multicopper oxidase family protein n=1 Tax=Bacillus cereus group TaxID=86661 RepID=UPI000B4AC35C|nr:MULTISPECIES: multicopper oxidase family protein [unclassified Bacillus cereus group]MDA1533702.1 multicopper oxidase family protein [Bacillus cereus group sp. TH254-2LC]MDA1544754.1 multicopper oxidase family protein [Bacillus cereus group sp. TH253LC]MDA1627108.1 multicopper oxidase family protein [Bacillus cereus group sp. TH172LC]MDA1832324.1 multicopper oxidase family protein [Bacillus cereus group sp. BY142LC]